MMKSCIIVVGQKSCASCATFLQFVSVSVCLPWINCLVCKISNNGKKCPSMFPWRRGKVCKLLLLSVDRLNIFNICYRRPRWYSIMYFIGSLQINLFMKKLIISALNVSAFFRIVHIYLQRAKKVMTLKEQSLWLYQWTTSSLLQ